MADHEDRAQMDTTFHQIHRMMIVSIIRPYFIQKNFQILLHLNSERLQLLRRAQRYENSMK